uniref:Reverse transcriptase domain-containing protein n=1 Tax=Scleropages formosus TaxID=113540 RepID=A0A8C9WAJ3_SCLFO
MCFVDLEKAFDCVPRGILWGVLRDYGVRGSLLRAVRSLYDRSRSLVRIAGSKSDLFPVHVGLCQGCPLSPILFIIFVDRISRRSQGTEGVCFGGREISSLLFADDVVLLASSSQDLQRALGRFAAECEAAGMRISTSKSEAMVLSRKKVDCSLRVRGELLPQVEEFKYLGVLFTSEGKMERQVDRRIGAASAVMRSLYRSVVVKRELSRKAKLSIYRSIYVPTLTYGHELWIMTERMRSRIQAAEMSFLRRVAGRTLRDRVRSSVTREELGVEPLLLRRCLLDASLGRCSGLVPLGGGLGADPGHVGKTTSPGWPGNALGFPQRNWRRCAGRGKSGVLCSDCCPRDPAPDKSGGRWMDGWMDE